MGKNYYLKDRDILDQALEHSWGKTADAKAKEKAYNREYYQRHKEEILRKARQAGEGIQRTAQNAVNDVRTAFSNERRQASSPMDRNTIRSYERAHEMNDRLLGGAKQRFKNAENRVQESNTRAERFRRASDAERRKYDSEVERAKALRADPRTSQLAVDARTEADSHLSKAAEYQKMAREAGQETYNRLNESNRAYKNQRRMANRRAASGAALNEASKAAQRDDWGVYDKRFDSKLARDAQNAYSKLRNPKEMARRAGESTKAYIDNAMGKNGRRGAGAAQEVADELSRQAKDQRSRANRFRDSARKSVQRSNSSYKQYQDLRDNPNTKGYAPQAYDNAVNEAHRAIEYAGQYAKNAKRSAASAAAANAASNAANRPGYDTRYDSSIVRGVQNTKAKARGAMSKAEKAAQQAREDAKKRMKKWFGHSDYSYKKNELCHHGIKDQKWGVRRFQYEDGTLTPAGRERYRDDTGSNTARVELPNGGTLKRSNGVWQHITNNPFDEYSQVSNSYAIGQLFKVLASNYGTGTSRVDLSNGGTLKNVNGQWKYISDNPLDEYRDISEDYATTLMMKEYKQRT